MRNRLVASLVPALAIATGIMLAPQASSGQATKAKAKASSNKAPRAHDGKADLQGIWQIFNTSIAASIEPHTPAYGIPAGFGAIVDPADGKIPYKPEARAKQQANFKNRRQLDPMNKCYMPGPTRVMYIPFPFQIMQTPNTV